MRSSSSLPLLYSLAGTFDTVERAERFIQKAGVLKGITTITHANAEEVRLRLAAGVALRHHGTLGETFMCVGDRQQSVSAMKISTPTTYRLISLSLPFGVKAPPTQSISSPRVRARGVAGGSCRGADTGVRARSGSALHFRASDLHNSDEAEATLSTRPSHKKL